MPNALVYKLRDLKSETKADIPNINYDVNKCTNIRKKYLQMSLVLTWNHQR